jgi:hypothetical protein
MMTKFIYIFFLILFIVALAVGAVAYSRNQNSKWDNVIEKAEVLVASIQKMIAVVEGPMPEIKRNLDKLHSFEGEPGAAEVIATTISAYEEYYQTSLTLIERLKENETIAKELLAAAEDKDSEKVKFLKSQLDADANEVNGWTSKHKQISDRIKTLRR